MSSAELDAFLGAVPRRYQWLSLIALMATLALAFLLLERFLNGPDLAYYTASVERADLTPVLSASGTVHAENEVTVSATEEGTLAAVPGPASGLVEQGQVLVRYDTTATLIDVAEAEGDLAAAGADAGRAGVTLGEARARFERYDSVWRRSQHRVPSLNEMDSARADVLRADIAQTAAGVREAAARARLAALRHRIATAAATAPFTANVVARLVAPGQVVHAGTPLFTLAQRSGRSQSADRLLVEVPLAAADAGRLLTGARARVVVRAGPEGRREAVLDHVDPANGAARRLAVFRVEGAPGLLRPGMSVSLDIDLPTRRDVLLVPNAALGFAPDGRTPGGSVYVLGERQEPRQVAVTLGASDGQRTEIVASGIADGDMVITGWRHSAPARAVRPESHRKP